MTDIVDKSDDAENAIKEKQIAAIRSLGRELHPVEECHWCGEYLPAGSLKLFCDSDCSKDYEKNK